MVTGVPATLCSVTSFVPQAWKVIRTRDTAAISRRMIARAGLELAGDKPVSGIATVVEAVVTQDSPLTGRSVAELDLRRRYEVSLLAISRAGARIAQKMGAVRLRAGDLLVWPLNR